MTKVEGLCPRSNLAVDTLDRLPKAEARLAAATAARVED